MKIKKLVLLSLVLCCTTVLKSCSTQENSKNNTMDEQKEINATTIEKKWIVTHFVFTKESTSVTRLKYQLSSIHLDLTEGRYTALDHYSLLEDEGNWKMEENVLVLFSDRGLNDLKIKINKLSENNMEAQILDHQVISRIELIKKR